jgi:hypothetical protein
MKPPDLSDVLVLAGVLLIAAGCWFVWSVAGALFWLGFAAMVAGILRAIYGIRQ